MTQVNDALVMVHGFPLDQQMWHAQVPLERELRIFRLDLPGFGGSSAPAVASLASYADAVLETMDQAGLRRAVLCGLSMGGYILFELCRRHPERMSALILCDTRAEPDSEEGRAARQHGMALVREGRRQELLDSYLPKLLSPASFANPELASKVRAMSQRASDAGIVAALQAMHDRPDSTRTLASIRVPTLIVVGSEDVLTPPAAARAMQARIAGSQLLQLDGAGHLTPMEQPEAFNAAVLDFTRNLS